MIALKWHFLQKKYKWNAYSTVKKTLYISLELNFRVKGYAYTKVKFCEGE